MNLAALTTPTVFFASTQIKRLHSTLHKETPPNVWSSWRSWTFWRFWPSQNGGACKGYIQASVQSLNWQSTHSRRRPLEIKKMNGIVRYKFSLKHRCPEEVVLTPEPGTETDGDGA